MLKASKRFRMAVWKIRENKPNKLSWKNNLKK